MDSNVMHMEASSARGTMHTISNVNLKVLVMDTDYYALQAINSYLAWDRRTRVTCLAEGSVLAEGTLDQVSANERVIEVYLGR